MITTILFDIDDTIFDWDIAVINALSGAAAEMNIKVPSDFTDVFHRINNDLWSRYQKGEIQKTFIFETRFNQIFKEIGIDADGSAFEKLFGSNLFHQIPKIDGADEIIEYLAGKYNLYIASNANKEQQITRLKMANLHQYFKDLFVSDSMRSGKPSKDFFDECFETLTCPREEVIMIGDNIHADIIGSKNYGLKTIWFNKNKLPLIPEEADYIVTDLLQIKDIL